MDKKLERNEANKVIGGVAAGLADYLDMELWLVRALFVALAIFGSAGIWIYIVLWIAVPARSFFSFPGYNSDYQTMKEQTFYEPVAPGTPRKESDGTARLIIGLVLTLFGVYFLLNEFGMIPYWFSIAKLWPAIFIIIGLIFLLTSGKKKDESKKFDYANPSFNPKTDDPLTSNDNSGASL